MWVNSHLTAYNAEGQAFRAAVDMDADGTIDLAGADCITETASFCANFGGEDSRIAVTSVYPTNSSATTLEVSRQIQSADGSLSWSISFARTNKTEVVRDPSNAARTETVTHPDGTQTISVYTNNLLMTVTLKNSAGGTTSTSSRSYDAWNRLHTVSETAANGDTRTTTYAYDAASQLTNATVAAGALTQSTTQEFDTMGRPTRTVLPDGGAVTNTYAATGELASRSGARTYPVSYAYSAQGRMATLSTYRSGMGGSADVTTWTYDAQRGWTTKKIYADGTTNGFAYLPNGQVQSRVSARGIGVTVSYGPDSLEKGLDYSDATPDVSITRDRLGRPIEISDGIGTQTVSYAQDGQFLSVSLPQIAGWSLEHAYDSFGRLTNSALKSVGGLLHNSLYEMDNAGRVASMGDGTCTLTYGFGADGLTVTNVSFDAVMSAGRTFDGLDRLTGLVWQPTNASAVSFAYDLNLADQRTTNTLGDGSEWRFTYGAEGQLESARKVFSDGLPVGAAQFEYETDGAGNRSSAELGAPALQTALTVNELNQCAAATVPGKIVFTGTASTNSTVSAAFTNESAKLANRHGEYFWQLLDATNSAALVVRTNLVRAVQPDGTNSLVKTETRISIVAQTPESLAWDADGNHACDGLWTNTWDGNNRLVATESLAAVPAAMKRRIEFAYDWLGRRTRKTALSGWTGSGYATTNVTTLVWDGWLLIAETISHQQSTITNAYTWGLDASGTVGGAGGVGGLAILNLAGTNCYAISDANGNVMGLVDAGDGSVVAEYEHGPFGEMLKCSGPLAKANPIRWTSKPVDDETGIVFYPARPYIPRLGRFAARDPIGEAGGKNLYPLCDDDPVNRIDPLGLESPRIRSIEEFTDPDLAALMKRIRPVVKVEGIDWERAGHILAQLAMQNRTKLADDLAARLIRHCPPPGKLYELPAFLPSPGGGWKNRHCCYPDDCRSQAQKFAREMAKFATQVAFAETYKHGKTREGSWQTSLLVSKAEKAGRMDREKGATTGLEGEGLKCTVWSGRAMLIYDLAFKEAAQTRRLCFRAVTVSKGAGPEDYHQWLHLLGPDGKSEVIDPWPSGGREITPAKPYMMEDVGFLSKW